MKKFLILLVATLLLATGANAAFEKVNTYENNFSDVSENNWFYENVKTAYELGFMNGKSDYVIEFDDPEVLVDSSERNSINKMGVNFKNGTGEIKDSMFICKAQVKANGSFDTQIKFEGLELNTKDYNKVTFPTINRSSIVQEILYNSKG